MAVILNVNNSFHDFGSCTINQDSGVWYAMIYNHTGTGVTINSIALYGGDSSNFVLASGGVGTPFVLANGASWFVGLKAHPLSLGDKATVLRITSVSDVTPIDIPLTCSGAQTAFNVSYPAAGGAVRVLISSSADLSSIALKSIDTLNVGYDNPDQVKQDEVVFYPSSTTLTFHDPGKILYADLKLYSRKVVIYKNSVIRFIGYVDIQSVSHPITLDETRNTTTFTLLDNGQKIKECKIADGADSIENPFGYPDGAWVRVTRVLKDIFSAANPDVDLSHNQDWSFHETYGSGPYTFDQIYIPTSQYFFEAGKPQTAADLLKLLCDSFGCISGMTDNNTAYFLKRWKNTGTKIALDGYVKKYTPEPFLQKKSFVQVVYSFNGRKYNEPNSLPFDFLLSDGSLKYPDNSFRIYISQDACPTDSTLACSNSANDIISPGSNEWVLSVKEPSIDATYRPLGETLALYHYNYLTNWREKVTMILYGTEYSFLDSFTYDGRTLRPISFEFDFFANETTSIFADVT